MAVGVKGKKTFGHLDDLLLLAARQAGHGLENLAEPAACGLRPLGLGLAEQFLNGDAENFGNRHQNIGTRDGARALPKADVGVVLIDLAGQFADGKTGVDTELTELGNTFCHVVSIRRQWEKCLHVDNILSIRGQCNQT